MSNYICTSCGAEVMEGKKFCAQCGSPVQATVTEAASDAAVSGPAASGPAAFTQAAGAPVSTIQVAPPPPVVRPPVPAPPVAQGDFIPSNTSKYEPISTKGYIGIWLLMMIPAINLLLLIVWACGGCRKINKRNYARAMLIIGAITLVLGVILAIVFRNAFNDYLTPFILPYGSY